MFEISAKKVDLEKNNTILKRNINLDKNLDCFILVSSNNSKLAENILNNTLEFLIDKISKKDAYKDFSIALESVNSYLKTWRNEESEKDNNSLDMIISILNENNYIFSNIWDSSAYLINKNSEVIELTEKNENKKLFSYISSWSLMNWDIVINSTISLLKFLTKSDLIDWLVLSEDIEIFNKNIKNILSSELLWKNCLVSSLKYENKSQKQKNEKIELIKDYCIKWLDNKFIKQVIWKSLLLKEKLSSKSKSIKSAIFILWISVSIFFLYTTLDKIVSVTTQTEKKQEAKNDIIEIRNFVRIAAENVSNQEVFEANILKAEELISKTKDKELFLNDLEQINQNINILKNQFNKIETFKTTDDNLIYDSKELDSVKLIRYNSRNYIINKNSVVWPIISEKSDAKIYMFNSLSDWEEFIDAVAINWDLYILTNKSKIVKFTNNGFFSFISVNGQASWWNIKDIEAYSSSLYTLTDNNQINKHTLWVNEFRAGTPYLKDWDLEQNWKIRDIWIDWWFYMIKENLSMIKFFSSPYRIESLILNKLPDNYSYDNESSIAIKARNELKYAYMLMNNKIWIFNTNTNSFVNTKSLTYVWQIEWSDEKIIDFYVNYDWELLVLNKKWIYKLNFEVSDDKLILK